MGTVKYVIRLLAGDRHVIVTLDGSPTPNLASGSYSSRVEAEAAVGRLYERERWERILSQQD